jgi:hypothetical protein
VASCLISSPERLTVAADMSNRNAKLRRGPFLLDAMKSTISCIDISPETMTIT